MYSFRVPFVFLATTFATAVLAIPHGVILHPKANSVVADLNQLNDTIISFNYALGNFSTVGPSDLADVVNLNDYFSDFLDEAMKTVKDMHDQGPFNENDSAEITTTQIIPVLISLNNTLANFDAQKVLLDEVAPTFGKDVSKINSAIRRDLGRFSSSIQSLEDAIQANFNSSDVALQAPISQSLRDSIKRSFAVFSSA